MKSIAIPIVLLFATASMGDELRPHYARAAVQPVTVQKLPNDEISIRYHVFPESNHYSSGVNYEKIGNMLQVRIDRCRVGEKCAPMAKTVIPLDEKWEAEVHIPYHGETVVLVHADSQDVIYP